MDKLNTGGTNVIFIVVDDLRARNLGCYNYKRDTSPNIDKLARSSVFFKHAFSTTTKTDPSLTTIFSGFYPSSHGIMKHGQISGKEINVFNRKNILLLPEILQRNGYHTMAVDWLGRWHKRGYDFYSGPIEESYNGLNRHVWQISESKFIPRFGRLALRKSHEKLNKIFYLSRHQNKINIRDDSTHVTDTAIRLLKEKRDRKFFLFLHYWDTHVPWYAPRKFERMFCDDTGEDIEDLASNADFLKKKQLMYAAGKAKKTGGVIDKYDASIRYVDSEIGRLLRFLEEENLDRDTLIILTADHGESLTEHNLYFVHKHLYDVTLHVPLIIKHPGLKKGLAVENMVSHVDLTPTVFDLLGIEGPDIPFDGRSLVPLIQGSQSGFRNYIYAEEYVNDRKCIRTRDYKYIHWGTNGKNQLFDLRSDPQELSDVAESEPERISYFKGMLSDRKTEFL